MENQFLVTGRGFRPQYVAPVPLSYDIVFEYRVDYDETITYSYANPNKN